MTLGFPTIVIPAIQGGEGRSESSGDIILNKDEISWFSKSLKSIVILLINEIQINILGSINLICVPLGCLFSGIITQPLGKRRAMQVCNILLTSY